MKFGINAAIESQAIPGMTVARRELPGIYSGLDARHPGLTSIVSATADVDKVCGGTLDTELTAWLRSMPSGSYVTLNPEGNLPSANCTAAAWREANSRLQALKTSAGLSDTIFTGYILAAHPVAELGLTADDWIIGHADWAGVNGFQAEIRQTPTSLFAEIFRQIGLAPGMPELIITGTNSAVDADNWLDAVIQFAVQGIDQGLSGFTPLDGVVVHAEPGSGYEKLPHPGTLAWAARECTLIR